MVRHMEMLSGSGSVVIGAVTRYRLTPADRADGNRKKRGSAAHRQQRWPLRVEEWSSYKEHNEWQMVDSPSSVYAANTMSLDKGRRSAQFAGTVSKAAAGTGSMLTGEPDMKPS